MATYCFLIKYFQNNIIQKIETRIENHVFFKNWVDVTAPAIATQGNTVRLKQRHRI